MPRSSGTYALPSGQPVVVGTTISDTVFNTLTTDIANELTNSIPRDGTAPPTANLPMGNFKITGIGNGTASNDAAAFGQIVTTATGITNTPAGDIAATTVQAAINELDTKKAKVGALATSGITGAAASGAVTASGITQSTNRLLGRTTAATGAIEEISIGSKLSLTGGVLDSAAVPQIQSVTCTQSGGALTFGLAASVLDFRSTTLTTGVPSTVVNPALSLVIYGGALFGAVSGVVTRLYLIAINNAGTAELAVINAAGGNDLSETGTINTSTTGYLANNTFYSLVSRTGVAYRVVGAIDAVNTAGAWATPVLVQGMGGNALTAMSSLGYGQTWQTPTRAKDTTYTNSTGRPIQVSITATAAAGSFTISVNGFSVGSSNATISCTSNFIVPAGNTYIVTTVSGTTTIVSWSELR